MVQNEHVNAVTAQEIAHLSCKRRAKVNPLFVPHACAHGTKGFRVLGCESGFRIGVAHGPASNMMHLAAQNDRLAPQLQVASAHL
jgi:hypothetical protein